MVKRLFDLIFALVLLVITMPIMVLIVLAIRLDSPGPVLYRSIRLGRGGRHFGLLRFRTVAVDRPATLPMAARVTRVGHLIRHYGLDDLPNLFNLLLGDLSCIGPRPTEPERVDLVDPLWQQILTLRPGMLSPAILQLGASYNDSPPLLKQQLEAAYVRQQSFGADLRLFDYALRQLRLTRGNLKRGKPSIGTDYYDRL
ncbi:MAG: sugar transferase [Caldilineaceae bacterium]